jgi:hypothetical protein
MTASAKSPNEETPSLVRVDMVGGYLGQVNNMIDEEREPKQFAILFASRRGSRYFLANLKTMYEIDRLCREMDSVLDEFQEPWFGQVAHNRAPGCIDEIVCHLVVHASRSPCLPDKFSLQPQLIEILSYSSSFVTAMLSHHESTNS